MGDLEDETAVTKRIAECVVNGILEYTKRFLKIAFVGVGRKEQKRFERIRTETGARMRFLGDYEKAKEWLLPCAF